MYTDYFGFSEKPFNVTPDPRFLYLSPAHQEALAAMLYGIQEKRGFISIIGEVGTGKTTLLRKLLIELDDTTETVLIFNTQVTFEQLLKNILWELNISTTNETKPEMINLLNNHLIAKLSAGENVAVIIDEAQNLSNKVLEELRMLSNLETEREKLLQILLTGQPELLTKLNSPSLRQLKQRIGINCFLTPLSDEDRMTYIAHRLSVAGSRDKTVFSKKALELICNYSDGIPRVINILCDNALLSAYGKDMRQIDTAIAEEVITDFSRSTFPVQEQDAPITPAQEVKKGFLSKSKAALILLLFTLLVLSALGISAYGSKIHPLDRLMNNVFSGLSLQWEKIENAFKETPAINQPQPSPALPELPTGDSTDLTLDINPEKPVSVDTASIQEAPSPPGHITPSIVEHSPLTDALPPVTNSTVISALKGDMVSTLIIEVYGTSNDTIFDIVKRANPQIEDLNRIDIGQEILFPTLTIDSFILEIAQNIFSIHIASFNSYEHAKYYLNKMKALQHPLFLSPVKIAGSTPWYRITIGGFNTREGAREAAKDIMSENYIVAKIISDT